MDRKLIITEDGSHSLYVPELDEHYHSIHGAIQESNHVFINSGLKKCSKKDLTILEVGFGTGLNAFLTLLESAETKQNINYIGIEKYPLKYIEFKNLNYSSYINPNMNDAFQVIHECEWEKMVEIAPHFSIKKIKSDLKNVNFKVLPIFDLIYFDAFAPNKQPDLWNEDIYKEIYDHSNLGSIFVTYCAKGIVRRELQDAGYNVERIQGPPGKKEMLRAIK